VPRSSLSLISPFARNLHNLESLAVVQKTRVTTWSKRGQRVQEQEPKTATQHKIRNIARISLESLNCVVAECQSVERILECLCIEGGFHGGCFYSPKRPHSHCSFLAKIGKISYVSSEFIFIPCVPLVAYREILCVYDMCGQWHTSDEYNFRWHTGNCLAKICQNLASYGGTRLVRCATRLGPCAPS
jgi:hypothetical protein